MSVVGIVGLGGMGAGLAERLLEQGWRVTIWNRSAASLEPFRGREGASVADTPAEAAASGLVASFVADDKALGSVSLGPDGVVAGLPAGGTHVSMSSVSPATIARLAATHEEAGGRLACAPVFGRPSAAAAGKLWVALSGAPEACRDARPMLEAVSQRIDTFGDDPAAAIKVKIAGNLVIASAIEAMSEAFAVLEGAGVDPEAFHAMMSASIFGSVIHQNYGRIILDEAFHPPGFKLALGRKDVGLARDLAAEAGVAVPFADVLWERFSEAVDAGLGEADWNAISRVTRRRTT